MSDGFSEIRLAISRATATVSNRTQLCTPGPDDERRDRKESSSMGSWMKREHSSHVTRCRVGRQATLAMLLLLVALSAAAGEEPATRTNDAADTNLQQRVPWLSSRLVGSPEPPLPYVAVPALSGVEWNRPLYAKREPEGTHLIVVQQGGEKDKPSRVLRVVDRPDAEEAKLLLELPGRLIYGLEFHPDYELNRFMYLFSNGPTGEQERQNRISRFQVTYDAAGHAACDVDSEQIILEWRSMGHDGGDLCFGHDGMLYITSGDGTSDSDNWLSAQDATNLLGGVLRIDVRDSEEGRPYSIPKDNPFVDLPKARGELWAIGLRNPWRMSLDAATGQIWVGNNGQDLWETVHLLGRGENYGWSVYEGSHPFYAHRQLGPGTLTLPTLEHHHSEARSLTGGVVYDGDRLPQLKGAYIYGDYSTGKVWAARHDGQQVTWHREIADTSIQIAGFSNTHRGDLLIIDLAGGIFRLQKNPQEKNAAAAFPRKLSETGIFASVAEHRVAPGVIPYSVNAPAWNDGATAERFLAIPGRQQISFRRNRGWDFPNGSVIAQTLSLDTLQDDVHHKRRIETRVLLRQRGEWTGYSYRWNPAQTDAVLVGHQGQDIELAESLHPSSSQPNKWRIPSRAECMSCHSRAVNYVLGLTEVQMNRLHDHGSHHANQLETLSQIGMFTESLPLGVEEMNKLVDPHDVSSDLESRARSYLHTNCSSCHVESGGGNARMQLEYNTALDKMQIISHFPQHETFGITRPRIIAKGRPDDSVMLARLNRRGRGQMPPLVSNRIDEPAVDLMRQWISAMQSDRKFVRDWSVTDLLAESQQLSRGRSFDQGKQIFRSVGCAQCHRIRDEFAGIGPNLTGVSKRLKFEEILTSIIEPSRSIANEYAETIITTAKGEVVRGRIESETEQVVVLRGRESFATPRTIDKGDIDDRSLSKISTMPEDALNELELNEILDLLAYLIADADPSHASFSD